MLKDIFASAAGITMFLFFALFSFPGGTIMMAMSCDSRNLDGWDWVLSVVVPGFGLFKSIFSSAC